MSEQHYYADVNLPFHVWVRERAGARGYRWVLRNASEMKDGTPDGRAGTDGANRRPGAPLQIG
jgi:hypothetical protein